MRMVSAVASLFCLAAGCGTAPRDIGGPCTIAADCQSPLVCRNAKCDNATNQACLGQSCDSQRDCQYVTGSLNVCSNNNDVTCDAYAHFCRNASSLNDGQVCTANSQCRSGLCDNNNGISGWCSRSCAGDALCSTGNTTCAKNSKGLWRCLRVCLKSDDCNVYNVDPSGAKCVNATSYDGSNIAVCR